MKFNKKQFAWLIFNADVLEGFKREAWEATEFSIRFFQTNFPFELSIRIHPTILRYSNGTWPLCSANTRFAWQVYIPL